MSPILNELMQVFPKNLASYMTGVAVRWRLPKPLSEWSCRAFANVFRLNMDEAATGISEYRTVEDLFTRKLKLGTRPISGPVSSPADGYLVRSERAIAGQAVQVKGLDYDLVDLVGQPRATEAFVPFWYQTIYLAPHNYHRVHAPFSGKVTEIRYIPGDLWPVNQIFVRRIPRLFNRNERLVFRFELENGGTAHVVMVGAFNVGRMVTPLLPGLVTNNSKRQLSPKSVVELMNPPAPVAAGDEIGTFMLGSTVVIVYDERAVRGINLVQLAANRPILMGQTLCE